MLMKKILLTFAAALFCAAVFAHVSFDGKKTSQNGEIMEHPRRSGCHAKKCDGTSDAAQARRNDATKVIPPEGLETDDYVLVATDYFDKIQSNVLVVGFYGNDVYVRGIYKDMPNAWIKGVLVDGKVIFAKDQYLGESGEGIGLYFEGYAPYERKFCDVLFEYDAAKKSMSTKQVFVINVGHQALSPEVTLAKAEIIKVNEMAGTPSTPHVDRVVFSADGLPSKLIFTIPLVDTNGNAMDVSKLSFVIYSDKHHELAKCTLRKSDYAALDEDMTEIPYLFSDGCAIYSCNVDLLMDCTGWTRIGVKAIYSGGDEPHHSSIGWASLESPDTLPDGVVPVDYMLNVEDLEYDNEEEMRPVKVAVDGENVYISGLASRFPDAWLKGTLKDDVVTIKGDKYIGEFTVPGSREVQHYYFNPDGDVLFNYNPDENIYTTWEYTVKYTDDANETGLTTFDNFQDAEITLIDDAAATPAMPEMNSFEMDLLGNHYATFYVYPYVDEDEFLMTSKLSYELFVDKGDGKETPYEFKASFYDLGSDMTTMPYGFNSTNGKIFHEGEYHTVFIDTDDVAMWKRMGVKTIYTGGDETNETPIRWMFIHPGVSGIDEVGTEVADVVYYDMQGRRANAATKGILIKRTRMADGTVKTVKVLNR